VVYSWHRQEILLQNIQIGSAAHQASYSMGTEGSFPGETGGNIVVMA